MRKPKAATYVYRGVQIKVGIDLMVAGDTLPGWGFIIPSLNEDGYLFLSEREALDVAKQIINHGASKND